MNENYDLNNVTKVKDLIEWLSRAPQADIVVADIGQEESADIVDCLVGHGTLKGFTTLKIIPYEE